jgi:hypothetical protein
MRKSVIFGLLCIVVLVAAATAGLVSVDFPGGDQIAAPSEMEAGPGQGNIDQGKIYLAAHNILGAREQFRLAVQKEPSNQEANLLYGVTRVFAVVEDGQSLHTSGLDSVREIFELAGFVFTQFNIYDSIYTKPDQLADTTPQTGAILDFLNTKFLPEINGAITNLATVTNTSFASVIDPSAINKGPGTAITVDYADALVIRALLQAMKCNLELLMVYGLNVDLPSIQADKDQLMTYKQFFNDSTFLTPKDAPRLATAKSALIAFIDNYTSAAQYLRNRSGSSHHLFVIDVPISDEAVSMTPLRLDKIRDELAKLKAGLNGKTYMLPITKLNENDRFVDLTKFFNSASPINFRSQLANCTSGTVLPDPTIGGLFPLGISSAFSSELPSISADILGVACTGRETPQIRFDQDSIYISDTQYYSNIPQSFTISNQGTANLIISSVSLVGLNSSEFTLSPGTCGTTPYTLAPGASCTAQLGLHTPYQYSFLEADVQINSTDVSSPRTYVELSGYTYASGNSLPPTGSFALTVNKTGAGSGTVECSGYSYNNWYPPNICSGTCGTFQTGAAIELTPQPSPGSVFTGWNGCDSVEGDTCYVKMYAAKTVTATFNKDTRTPVVTAYPPDGTYHGPLDVTLASNKEANIYYTLNGAAPSSSSTQYTGPFSITAPTTTLRYIAIDPFNVSSAAKTETYSWLPDPVLTLSLSGSGGGTINNILPYSGIINCSRPGETGDKCTATLPYETILTLHASPDSTALFSNWSPAYCPGTGDCKITLDANTSVTGTFVTMPPVMVETSGFPTTYHSTIQDAFANAHADSVIRLQALTFPESNLSFSRPFSISILGGYNAGFLNQADYSYLQGVLTIISGSITIDRLVVKSP